MKPTDITIDEEFEQLIPPLSPDERKELKESLSSCGLLSPLIVWKHEGKTILVDGHNRLSLWKESDGFNEEFKLITQELRFGNRDKVKEWIIKNQLGRRNLTPDNFKMLLGRLYNTMKKSQGSVNQHTVAKAQNELQQSTAEGLAKAHGVSRETVKRAGKLAEKVDEIKKADPNIKEKEAVQKAKKSPSKAQKPAPIPSAEDEQEALKKLLEIRWKRFLSDIPVTSHKSVRTWIQNKLSQNAL